MNNPPTFRPRACTLALEPRILFDGAAMAAVDDHLVAEQHHYAAETINHQVTEAVTNQAEVHTDQEAPPDAGAAASATLLLIDGRVRDTATLLGDVPANVTAIVVEAGESGFTAAAAALDSLGAVDSIQIISHGTGGGFFLGSDYINAATVVQYSDQLQQWGATLTDGGDILLYGCHIGAGAEGALLLSQLAGMTGADVAASLDATGGVSLGGNWTLEVSTGSIEALPAITAAARDSYQYLLAAPVITDTMTAIRTVAEDEPLLLTGLSVTDADNDTLTVTFTTDAGTFQLGTTAAGLDDSSGDGTGTLSFSGSAVAVNEALNTLTFQGLPDKNGSAEVTMTASDGESTVETVIAIMISPVNDAPTWSGGTGVEVAEGEEVFFDPVQPLPGLGFEQSQLGLREVDNSASQVILKVTHLPGQGTLRLSGTELAVGSTFAASQLGSLSYTHNGSQVLANTGDSFFVTVDDGAGGQLFDQEVSITVTPVNDAPSVTGRVTVIEGEAQVNLVEGGIIPATGSPRGSVTVSDPDDSSDRLSYAVTGLPEHGTLFYGGEPIESADVPFTVDDLTLLTYSHDGSEANGVPDGFDLRVTDSGGGTDTPLSTVERVVIDVINNNDDPVLVTNVPQTMPSDQSILTITGEMLKVDDVDSPATTLTYTVTTAPDLAEGYFTVGGHRLTAGSSFTQADIDAGRVVYHNHSSNEHTAALSFTVKDGDRRLYPTPRDGGIYDDETGTTLTVNTFSVEINENSPVFDGDTPGATVTYSTPTVSGDNAAVLLESGSVVLTDTDLSASDPAVANNNQLVYRLISLPKSGTLYLGDRALSYSDSFTQYDVDQGRIRFEHAGDEVFSDQFTYTVSNGVAESSAHVFQLNITPQNDTPVARVGERVFGAEGAIIPINAGHIVLTDADRDVPGAGEYAVDNVLSFRITVLPVHGGLYLNDMPVTVDTVISAADLAAGGLEYRHDGSENHTDAFTLVPFDNQGVGEADITATNQASVGTPLIVPITLTPVNDTPEFAGKQDLTGSRAVREGSTTTILGAADYSGANGDGSGDAVLHTDDVGYLVYQDPDNTTEQRQYRITTAPVNGVLLLGGTALSTGSVFTQDDLDAGRVQYRHNGSETSSDFFNYVVSDGDYSANETTSFTQGTPAAPATYVIDILPANDPPTITVSTGRLTVDSAVTWVDLPEITLKDPDIAGGVDSGERDFIQVRVEFLDDQENPYGVLSFSDDDVPTGVTIIGATEGSSLVFQGSLADVQAALGRVQARLATDTDPNSDAYAITISVDDRLRDDVGNLTNGANGGSVNENGSAVGDEHNVARTTIQVLASRANDPPVITAPDPVTVQEDIRTQITGLSFTDVDTFDSNTTTLTLSTMSDREGEIYFSASGSSLPAGVTLYAGAVGSSSITLQGTTAALNAALATLYYQGATDYNGDDSLTIEVNDHGNTGQDGGSSTASATVALGITPVNDPPRVTMPVGDRYLTGAGVFNFTDGDALGFDDPSDIRHTLPDFDLSSDRYTITLEAVDPNGDFHGRIEVATTTGLEVVSGLNTGSVTLTGTKADLDAALATVSYHLDNANADSAITFRMTVDDLGNGGTAIGGSVGSLTATGECTFYVTDTNDPPGFADLDAVSVNTYVENNDPVVIDPDATLFDPELDMYPSWSGGQVTVHRTDGPNRDDVFGFTGSGATGINQSGTDLRNGTTVIGSITNADGRLHITFNANATADVVDRVVQSITYRNTSEAPPPSVELTFTVNDQNSNDDGGTAGSGQNQGSGGPKSFSQNVTVNITPMVDHPVLSTGSEIEYTENDPPQTVDSGLTITDLDDDQMARARVAISSGFVSGDVLAVDVSNTNISAHYDADTGLLTLEGVDTIAHYQQVLRSLTYASTSDDPTDDATSTSRTLTYTVQDNGSSGAGPGEGSTTRTVNVVAVNDAPVVSGAESTRVFTENDPPLPLEPAGWSLSDVDDTQMTEVEVHIVSGRSDDDVLSAEDTALPSGWSQNYNSITGVLTLSGPAADIAAVITAMQSVTYFNSSEDPTVDERVIEWRVRDANSDQAGAEWSNVVETRLQVISVPDPPVATDDQAVINEDDVSVSGNVKTNDSDVDNTNDELSITGIRRGTEAQGGVMTDVAPATDSANGTEVIGLYGTLRLGADGSWTYSLDNDNPIVNALKTGDTLQEYFTYELTDPTDLPDTAQLTVTINGVTDGAPTIEPVDENGAEPGHLTVFEAGLTSETDTRETNEGHISLATADGLSTVTINGTTLSLSQLQNLGDHPVTIPTANGLLTVTGFTPTAEIGGVPVRGELTYTYTLLQPPSTPGADAWLETVPLVVTDAGGEEGHDSLIIRVIDDTPTAEDDVNSVVEGVGDEISVATGNVVTGGSPGDVADRIGADHTDTPVVGVAFGATVGSVGTPLSGAYGELLLAADGSYTYTLDNGNPVVNALRFGETLTETFTYTVSDQDGDQDTASLTITIHGTNDPPVARDDGPYDILEDTPLDSIDVLANDTDPENDPLTVVDATVDPSQGSVSINADGTLRFVPAQDFHGTAVISYTISDGAGGFSSAQAVVRVAPVNDPPVAVDDYGASPDGRSVDISLLTNDYDVDGDPLTATHIAGVPLLPGQSVVLPEGVVTLQADGVVTFAPNPGVQGTVRFSYTISDGQGGSAEGWVAVQVTPEAVIVPPAPSLPPLGEPPLFGDQTALPGVWFGEDLRHGVIRSSVAMGPTMYVLQAVEQAQEESRADQWRSLSRPQEVQPAEIRSMSLGSGLGMDPAIFVTPAVRQAQTQGGFIDQVVQGRVTRLSLGSDRLLPVPDLGASDPQELLPAGKLVEQAGVDRTTAESVPRPGRVAGLASPHPAPQRGALSFGEQLRAAGTQAPLTIGRGQPAATSSNR
ncbi:cadherin-like domain-containing protein [Desulfobulbus oligotrophicus]|uniref:Tandem-95 repeat protein n=1 Tax=Desulfobulbus oligotrophicus TaxID=1909699 RepID=A0A7T5VDE4_9BACT|nr:cadherin-like domain-containing protein [Desulfobulbus oligotrophicus]QQG65847.1 tandem-95 repeat protein [Desulfobulbus oligotrophicus]